MLGGLLADYGSGSDDEDAAPAPARAGAAPPRPAVNADGKRVIQFQLPISREALAAAARDVEEEPRTKKAKPAAPTTSRGFSLSAFLPAPVHEELGGGSSGGGTGARLDLGGGPATSKPAGGPPPAAAPAPLAAREADGAEDEEEPAVAPRSGGGGGYGRAASAYSAGASVDYFGVTAASTSAAGAAGHSAAAAYRYNPPPSPYDDAQQQQQASGGYGGYDEQQAAAYYYQQQGGQQQAYEDYAAGGWGAQPASDGGGSDGGAGGGPLSEPDRLLAQAVAAEQARMAKRARGHRDAHNPFFTGPSAVVREVSQSQLTADALKLQQLGGGRETGMAFGPEHASQIKAEAGAKPSSQLRRKHQITQLFYDAKLKEIEHVDARARGLRTKAETKSKYGW